MSLSVEPIYFLPALDFATRLSSNLLLARLNIDTLTCPAPFIVLNMIRPRPPTMESMMNAMYDWLIYKPQAVSLLTTISPWVLQSKRKH